ncbi:MAG: hypothetical protein RQ741_00975 [Wenzhouxiangellaceae bacterium]|nr:hypothetical protein [Wenzhouxiangellaceae bacterium]
MRVVILSSTLGYGHIRAAEAVEEALREQGPGIEIETIDFWSLMNDTVAGAIKAGYLSLVTHEPELYDHLHRLDRAAWRAFLRRPEMPRPMSQICSDIIREWFPGRNGFPARGESLDQVLLLNLLGSFASDAPVSSNVVRRGLVLWMHRMLVKRLKRRLQRRMPDAIVATQMMPASLLPALDLDDLPTIAVLTDYGVHPFWRDSSMSHYCIATDSMAAGLLAPNAKRTVSVTGIPLMKGFRRPHDQAVARTRLGIDADRRVVLVTGGGYGIGALETLKLISKAELDCEILVAASGLRHDSRELSVLTGHHSERIHVFCDNANMPTLVSAADVVVGKPGGLSVSEALACGRPFFAVSCLGGQERFNVDYLKHHRVGDRFDADTLIEPLKNWLEDPLKLAQVKSRAWNLGKRNGAEQIASVLCNELIERAPRKSLS